jgi:hypothetical protein
VSFICDTGCTRLVANRVLHVRPVVEEVVAVAVRCVLRVVALEQHASRAFE